MKMFATLCFSLLSTSALLSGGALLSGCAIETGLVDITVKGDGQVVSNPHGITCNASGGACDAQLGSNYVLYAEPAGGSHLDHWEGDELCTLRGRATVVVSVSPSHEVTCTAVFASDTDTNAQ